MTNGNHIRTMDDGELGAFLVGVEIAAVMRHDGEYAIEDVLERIEEVRKWLEREVRA